MGHPRNVWQGKASADPLQHQSSVRLLRDNYDTIQGKNPKAQKGEDEHVTNSQV